MSFVTNTDLQAYSGETAMSYLSQFAVLTTQNFASAAVGVAALLAVIRGFSRKESQTVGNFWVDITRFTLYVLVPLNIVLTLLMVSQGAVQEFCPQSCRARHLIAIRTSFQLICDFIVRE